MQLGLAAAVPLTLTVPNDPTLRGLGLYMQGVVFDPGANALGLATTDLLTVIVGS